MRVLVVDDERTICDGLRILVERLAMEAIESVRAAYRADRALELAKEYRPDILVTDIRMPGRSGLELIAAMRKLLPELQSIVVTGHDDFVLVREALRLDAIDYLLKPATRAELAAAVSRAIERSESQKHRRDADESTRRSRLRAVVDAAWPWLTSSVTVGVETLRDLDTIVRDDLDVRSLRIVSVDSRPVPGQPIVSAEHAMTTGEAESLVDSAEAGEPATVIIHRADGPASYFVVAGDERSATRAADAVMAASVAPPGRDANGRWVFVSPAAVAISDLKHAFRRLQRLRVSRFRPGRTPGDAVDMSEATDAEVEAVLADIRPRVPGQGSIDTPSTARRLSEACAKPARAIAVWDRLLSMAVVNRRGSDVGESITPFLGDFGSCDDAAESLAAILAEQSKQTKPTHRDDAAHVAVRRAKEFVCEHYGRPHTMHDVADLLGLSYAYFSTLFKQHTGDTYSGYLARHRMEQARRLLIDEALPVSEVAAAVGYAYPKHFSRAFKRFWGVSPGQVRTGRQPTA